MTDPETRLLGRMVPSHRIPSGAPTEPAEMATTAHTVEEQMMENRAIDSVMTSNPVSMEGHETVSAAAQRMRDDGIGDVLVTEGGRLVGIVTDRDIAVRVVGGGLDPEATPLSTVCSTELHQVDPRTPVEDVVELMRVHGIRRVPVVREDEPIGVVSLGDLALVRDRNSVLADISSQPAGR